MKFWCTTYVAVDRQPHEGLTIGARAADARHFGSHEATQRAVSHCPDGECCRRPPSDVAAAEVAPRMVLLPQKSKVR